MKRYWKYLVNLPLIAAIVGGVWFYNYYTQVQVRHDIHVEIMGRMLEGVHAKEFKPVAWDTVKAGDDLSALNGQPVVMLGYGKPSNSNHIRDLGSLASIGMDPCCPKPISYRNVTQMALTPLPYHCFVWKEAPVAVALEMDPNKPPAAFVADQPGYYRGTLEVKEEGGRTVVALTNAEKIDTSKGSVFGKAPAATAAAAAAAAAAQPAS
jgi:hypothetical protein